MQKTLALLKFGGSSLATLKHVERAADIVEDWYKRGHSLIVVVSAMGTRLIV